MHAQNDEAPGLAPEGSNGTQNDGADPIEADGGAPAPALEPDRAALTEFITKVLPKGIYQFAYRRPATAEEKRESIARWKSKGRKVTKSMEEAASWHWTWRSCDTGNKGIQNTIAQVAAANGRGHDCYYGLNQLRSVEQPSKAQRADIGRVIGLYADPDAHEGPAAHAALAKTVLPLTTQEREASYVVDSGGGFQAIYLLDEPITMEMDGAAVAPASHTAAQAVETVAHQLAELLHGDHSVATIAALARMPGTVNHKRGRVARVVHRSNKRWNLEALAEGLPDAKARMARVDDEPEPGIEQDERWREKVVMALDAPDLLLLDESEHDAERYPSRSEHVPGLIARLARAGLTAEQAFSTLISANGTWTYALQHRDGSGEKARAFLWAEVQNAFSWVEQKRDEEHTARDAELAPWLDNLIYVEEGGYVADIRRPGNQGRLMKWAEFERSNANQVVIIPVGKGKVVEEPKVYLWLKHKDRKTALGRIWDPRQGPLVERMEPNAAGKLERALYVNAYQRKHHRGDLADPALLAVFREHLAHMYGEEAKYQEAFFAHRVQRPGERPPVAILSVARKQGSGRGWLNKVFSGVVGEWNVKKVTAKNLEGQYNGFLSGAVDIYVEEVAVEGKNKWEMGEEMRDLITAPRCEVNHKYGGMGQEELFASIRLETNRPAAIKVTEEDRRLLVLEVTSPLKKEQDYIRLYQLLVGPAREAFLASVHQYLASYDLTEFLKLARAPLNNAKKHLISVGSTDVEQSIVEFIQGCPAKAAMRGTIIRWLAGRGIDEFQHEAEILAVLRKRAFKPYDEKTRRVRDPGDDRPTKERRKVAPWILQSDARDLDFATLQAEVEKAHKWAVAADMEDDDDLAEALS